MEYRDKSSLCVRVAKRRFSKVDLLPLTSDLKKLRLYLINSIDDVSEELKVKLSLMVWQKLAGRVLCRVAIFNKRRGGEASKMLFNSFQEKPNWEEACPGDIYETLQPLEKELMKRQ